MKNLSIVLLALAALMFTGCAGAAFGGRVLSGSLFANTRGNENVTPNTVGSKTGEACASSILGWVTTGDASVAAAAEAGGVTKIASVDNRFKNYVGFWAEYCVIVTGE